MRSAVLNAPPGYLANLEPLPEGLQLSGKPAADLDFVQVFVRDAAELGRLAPEAVRSVKFDGLLWVCYLKGGKKAGTDLNRDLLWQAMQPYGVTGVSLVAIDESWSAMRLRPTDSAGK